MSSFPYAQYWRKLLLFLGGGCLVLQFASISGHLAKNADIRSVLSTVDDDGGFVLGRSLRARWWNDVGGWGYGPVTYRLGHTFGHFNLLPLSTRGETDYEMVEKNHHFALMMVSFVCLYIFCFFLTGFISSDPLSRIVMQLLFVASFLSHDIWVRYIYTPHPDHLFSLFVFLAMWMTYRWLENSEDKYFRLSAFLWGIAASTKLFVVLFVPAYIFLFMPPFNLHQFKKMFRYAGWMLLGYFLIGFPQNFLFWKNIKFLLYQSQMSHLASLSWIRELFLEFVDQAWKPVLAVLVAVLVFQDKRPEINRKALGKAIVFLCIPLILFHGREVISSWKYYTFPFIYAGTFLWVVLLLSYHSKLMPKKWRQNFWPPVFLVLIVFLFQGVPSNVNKVLNNLLTCRDGIWQTHKKVQQYLKEGHSILVNAYAPFDRYYERKGQVLFSWDHTYADLEKGKQSVLVFNHPLYKQRYLENEQPTHYVAVDTPEFSETRKFYQTFATGNQVPDLYGQRWSRVWDRCHIEVWEREGVPGLEAKPLPVSSVQKN